jgi:hypothetical protein
VPRNGPPDDFNRLPTQQARFGTGEYPLGPPPQAPPGPQAAQESPEPEAWQDLPTTFVPFQSPDAADTADPDDLEREPTPWYRKPVNLIIWAVMVLILIGLIIYGIIELIGGNQATDTTPSSTTTTTPTTTAPSTTTTSPSASPSTSEPPPSTTVAPPPPTNQPTHQPTHQPTQTPSTHHHLPPLPSVITIPEVPTVITLPPDLTR